MFLKGANLPPPRPTCPSKKCWPASFVLAFFAFLQARVKSGERTCDSFEAQHFDHLGLPLACHIRSQDDFGDLFQSCAREYGNFVLSESSKTLGRDRLGDNWWLQVWIGVGSLLDPEQYGNWCTILADDDRTRLRPGRISSEKVLNVTIGAFIIATIGLLPLSWRSEFYQGPTSQKEDNFAVTASRGWS